MDANVLPVEGHLAYERVSPSPMLSIYRSLVDDAYIAKCTNMINNNSYLLYIKNTYTCTSILHSLYNKRDIPLVLETVVESPGTRKIKCS